jgi:DNA-binding phage protein
MALTLDFKETVKDRVDHDPAFREELLREGIECLLTGDLDTGKAILRDYINATIGFDALASLTDKSPKSLMRMLGPKGNPQAHNLFEIIACLQKREGIHFEVRTVR